MVLKQRNRQIAFRVTQDEYDRLCEFCVSTGARSLSDVARSALRDLAGLNGEAVGSPLAGRMHTLDLRLRELNRKIEQLAGLVDVQAPAPRRLSQVGVLAIDAEKES